LAGALPFEQSEPYSPRHRATLANLLGVPDRMDWKLCAKSDPEEKKECAAFKKAFADFDPSK
jgi:hypothetical protein